MGVLNYTVVIQMMNFVVYRLRAVDDTITYLIEDCNTFETTNSFDEVMHIVRQHMQWYNH